MLKTGDLVRIVVAPLKRQELYWTLAIVLENQRGLSGKLYLWKRRVVLLCLHDGGEILTTEDKLELIAK